MRNPMRVTVVQPQADKTATQLKESREDVRSYALLMMQIVTLLLTAITLVLGWGAKDFVGRQYELAWTMETPSLPPYGKSGPSVVVVPSTNAVPIPPAPPLTGKDLDQVAKRFRQLIWTSPTTSLFLMPLTFFVSLLLGVLIVVQYLLHRRRYRCHLLERELGMYRDLPLMDPVLTTASMGLLALIVAVCALFLWSFATAQLGWGALRALGYQHRVISGLLCVMWIIVSAKFSCSVLMALHFKRWNQSEAWRMRWPSAQALLEELRAEIRQRQLPTTRRTDRLLGYLIGQCKKASDTRNNRNTRDLWRSKVAPHMRQLVRELRSNVAVWKELRELIFESAITLRVRTRFRDWAI